MVAQSTTRLYEVEDQWSAALDRGGLVDFFGSSITLPSQRQFGSVQQMQEYVDEVIAQVNRRLHVPPAVVRSRRGPTRAHYEVDSHVIAIPLDTRWAPRETVLLHELCHHVVGATFGREAALEHGPEFVGTLCALVALVLGEESALVLRSALGAAQIGIGSSPLDVRE